MTTKTIKIAGAPISWGVCEAPNWGHQMQPGRVLQEMAELELGAMEFGPLGFLPVEPSARAEALKKYSMVAVGGFFPILLHDSTYDPLPAVKEELESYIKAGAKILVLAASTGVEGYEIKRPELTAEQWKTFFTNCDRISEYAATIGVTATVHPHVGTMIESKSDIYGLLEGSDIGFTLDTGHMIIGGTDPVEFAQKHPGRVKHVHMKDVNMQRASKVVDGSQTYNEGVKAAMYTPLGEGDVDVKAIVTALVNSGYDGWFVLEQDLMLDGEPESGGWPFTDAKKSVDYLRAVAASLN